MKALVKTYLNIRTGSPEIRSDNNPGTYYSPGDEIDILETVIGDPYKGNKVWYRLTNGTYVWSGGIDKAVTEKVLGQFTPKHFDINNCLWLKNFGIAELWEAGLSGAGVKIAVLDTGVYLPHPDLTIELKNCKNVTGDHDTDNLSVLDIDGHGTHCIGIIGTSEKSAEIKGIAFNSTIFPVKVTKDSAGDTISNLEKGIVWAIAQKVDIISISKTFAGDNKQIEPTIIEAKNNNILVVCAGGNNSDAETKFSEIDFPARYPDTLSVGAIDVGRNVSTLTITSGRLKLFAPGVGIRSTFLNGGYKPETGSSQAAPFVAGVAALIIEAMRKKGKSYTVDDLQKRFIECGDPVAGQQARIINPTRIFQSL